MSESPASDLPPFEQPNFEETAADSGEAGLPPRSTALGVGLPWLMVFAVMALVIFGNGEPPEEAEGPNVLVEIQGKVLVGLMDLAGSAETAVGDPLSELRRIGSVSDRAGSIILVAELNNVESARDDYSELLGVVEDRRRDEGIEPDEREAALLSALGHLFDKGDPIDNVPTLSEEHRATLVDQLGWVGELAMVPKGLDPVARDQVVGPAEQAAIVVIIGMLSFGVLTFSGFVALIGLMVAFSAGWTTRHFRPGKLSTARSIETFAVWMVAFVGLQIVGGLISHATGLSTAFAGLGAFFISLLALVWPLLRGSSWADVRSDFGLHFGRNPLVEFFSSATGYCMMLPCLVAGAIGTAILATLAQSGSEPGPLDPTQFASHPIVPAASGAEIVERLALLALASIAAPLIEEIFFRGVLYRHLRQLLGGFGTIPSIIASTAFGSFVFAAVHPQGFVAIPALMGIATGITILREWRDTVIPGMIVHGAWNGGLLAMLFLLI